MPNAQVLDGKKAVVTALTERLQNATSGVLIDYKGISVAEDTALRAEMRKNELDYSVVKNTLVRFAIDKVGMNELDEHLNGTTSMVTGTHDPIIPIRLACEFAKKYENKFEIKAGFMEGKVIPLEDIQKIGQLPSKDALYAKVLGTMLAPISSLAVALGQILEQKGGNAEEAPAAE